MFQTYATNQYASCISHDALCSFLLYVVPCFCYFIGHKISKNCFLLIPLTPIPLTTAMEIEKKWQDWNESNTIFTWNESNTISTWNESNMIFLLDIIASLMVLTMTLLFGSTFQSYNTLVKEPFSIPTIFAIHSFERILRKVYLSPSIWNFMRKLCPNLQILRIFFFPQNLHI